MPSASSWRRRIISWAATSAPSLRRTPASTWRAVTGSAVPVVRGLRVGVVVGVHVEPVGLAAPRGRDVEDLAGGGRRHHGVRGVDAAALGPMRRRGVGQLDVLGHVVGREHHSPGARDPLDGHGTVVMGGSDGPLVAVADPPSAGAETPVVLTGDHLVAHTGRPTAGHVQPRALPLLRRRSDRPGPGG